MTLLCTYPPNTPEWHEARRWRIGGSEIAAACGLSPWTHRDQLIADKIAGTVHPQTPAMWRGTMLEAAVLGMVAERRSLTTSWPTPLIYDDAMAGTHVHPRHDWALYNPDAVTTDGVLVEAKTADRRAVLTGDDWDDLHRPAHAWGRAGTDRVPMHYLYQVQWGLGILGLDRAILAILAAGERGFDFATYPIRFNPALFTALLRAGQRFITDLHAARDAATTDRTAA